MHENRVHTVQMCFIYVGYVDILTEFVYRAKMVIRKDERSEVHENF